MRGEERNPVAARSLGHAGAVPILFEPGDATGDLLSKPHLPVNVSVALAAGLGQINRGAVRHDVEQSAQALGRPGIQARMADDEAQHLVQRSVDELEIPFQEDMVGRIELADTGGIAAAAEVLE
jgi:hypothetical protein